MRKVRAAEPGPLFRLWIASYSGDRPERWSQVPEQATALELVDETVYTKQSAVLFLEGFNTAMLGDNRALWAVAVPVSLSFVGDARVGEPVVGYEFGDSEWNADTNTAAIESAQETPR